jgi:hypothetical protein
MFWCNVFLVWLVGALLIVLFMKGASIVSRSNTDKE